jgi:transcriptional regulator with XRE-family HTH domain
MRIFSNCHAHILEMILRPRAKQIADELRAELKRLHKSQEEVAREFGVTQPRISRILKGEFTRRSTLAPRLFEQYLGKEKREQLELHAHEEEADHAFEVAVRALELMWDGTPEHAARLKKMIVAVRSARAPVGNNREHK